MSIHSLAWAQSGAGQLTYTLSFKIPNRGNLDLYHNAYAIRSARENAVYALRNTAIEDLLYTRQALKILIGGTQRLHRAVENGGLGRTDLSFAVPGGVIDLYLLGPGNEPGEATSYGRTDSAIECDQPCTPALPDEDPEAGEGMGFDHGTLPGAQLAERIPQIANAIQWIGRTEPGYDAALRASILLHLANRSAQLVVRDKQIQFVHTDFFATQPIAEEYFKQFIQPKIGAVSGTHPMAPPMIGVTSDIYESSKNSWLREHGTTDGNGHFQSMKDLVNAWAGHHSYILNRNHLLGVEVDEKPLYKHIYDAMTPLGMPPAGIAQRPVDQHLPQGKAPIQIPNDFENAVHQALDALNDPGRQHSILNQLHKAVDPKIDRALIHALEKNTEQLKKLSQELHYAGEASSELLQLTRYEDLWQAAMQKYHYLLGPIDFLAARQEFADYWERREVSNKNMRYAAMGIGIGVLIAATVLTGGRAASATASGEAIATAGASMFGASLRNLLIGAGLVTEASLAYGVYVDSDRTAEIAANLYAASSSTSGYALKQGAIEMRSQDMTLLIASLVQLGIGATSIGRFAATRPVVVRAGQRFVQISSEELASLRKSVAELSERAKIAPLGRALLATARALLGMGRNPSGIVSLEEGVAVAAQARGTTSAAILKRIESVKGLGQMIKGWRARDLSRKIEIEAEVLEKLIKNGYELEKATELARTAGNSASFGKLMLNDQVNNFAVSVVAEYMVRGDKMITDDAQRRAFILNMIRGAAVTTVLAWNGQRIAPSVQKDFLGKSSMLKVDGSNRFWDSSVGKLTAAGMSNAAVGMVIDVGVDGLDQTLQHFENLDNPKAPTVKDRIVHTATSIGWSGVTLGISSTLRYNLFVKWAEKYIRSKVESEAGRQILISSVKTGNNLFGGWSYVYFGQMVGAVAGDTPVDESTLESKQDLDLDLKLQVEGMGGAFLKVEGNGTAVDHMFDFLREGDDAGPGPVFQ